MFDSTRLFYSVIKIYRSWTVIHLAPMICINTTYRMFKSLIWRPITIREVQFKAIQKLGLLLFTIRRSYTAVESWYSSIYLLVYLGRCRDLAFIPLCSLGYKNTYTVIYSLYSIYIIINNLVIITTISLYHFLFKWLYFSFKKPNHHRRDWLLSL